MKYIKNMLKQRNTLKINGKAHKCEGPSRASSLSFLPVGQAQTKTGPKALARPAPQLVFPSLDLVRPSDLTVGLSSARNKRSSIGCLPLPYKSFHPCFLDEDSGGGEKASSVGDRRTTAGPFADAACGFTTRGSIVRLHSGARI